MLSGGMDSRMLGGYLRRRQDNVAALSFGRRTDHDLQCAIGVARVLGFRQEIADNADDEYASFAELEATWGHLAGGFSHIPHWGSQAHLRQIGRPTVVGYLSDAIVGASHMHYGYAEQKGSAQFETFFEKINRWGIPPAVLKTLLRPNTFGRDIVDDMVQQIRRIYEDGGQSEAYRAWVFDLGHRQRFHVGMSPWILSFGAWPVLPVVDRAVLECMAGLPPAVLAGRHLQRELLRTCFPHLASLPLDRGHLFPMPLAPRLVDEIRCSVHEKLAPLWERLPRLRPQRSYYLRVYDFNGPGWRGVRRAAEAGRDQAYTLFEKSALDSLLPAPEVTVQFNRWQVPSAGLRLLLGCMLWHRDHL